MLSVVLAGALLAPQEAPHWSLAPLRTVAVPDSDSGWTRTPVDAFVERARRAQGLAPAAEADRRTLIRRLTYDLHGLPPDPAAIEAFVADPAADAYERLVDRLLASPRYGERMARHWLDVAHYADTHGYDKDKLRENAWPYRDWVIEAFDRDLPYARFVQMQIAGDVLFPGDADGIRALGFVAAGPWDYVGHVELREGTRDKRIARSLDRDDMLASTMTTFASTTVHCARCHDHKFDPIPQRDYYALQAVFAGVERADRAFGEGGRVYAIASAFAPEGAFTPPGGPRPIAVLGRGDVDRPQAQAAPGALSCLPALAHHFDGLDPTDEGARRAALARWLTDRDNPLTWRSIVNRVWLWHFGRALAGAPNDFGRMGEAPSHPELLDWLADWFRGHGSLKELHRLLVTSAVYRQSSEAEATTLAADPNNRWLARTSRRRLEAESVRDAILAVSGRLDLRRGGPPDRHFGFVDDHSPHYDYRAFDVDSDAGRRRSIHRLVVRSVPDPWFEALDCADPSLSTPQRYATLTPLQALAMLNDRFVVRHAEHFAARLEREVDEPRARIPRAFALALGRAPQPEERAALDAHAERHGLARACRVLFNLNEFVFVD